MMNEHRTGRVRWLLLGAGFLVFLLTLCLSWSCLFPVSETAEEAGDRTEVLSSSQSGDADMGAGQGIGADDGDGATGAPAAVGAGSSSGPGRVVKRVSGPAGGFGGMAGHFELVSATPESTHFTFELGGYEVREVEHDGALRSVLRVSDGWSSQQRGYPSLPRYRVSLASPAGHEPALEVVDAQWDEIRCAPPVASLGLHARDRVPDYVENKAVYEGDGVWPGSLATVGEESWIRQVPSRGALILAASYDFGRGVLRVCRRCEVRVVSSGASSEDYGTVSRDMDFRRLQTRDVLNVGLLRGQEASTRVGTLLVVVPDGWREAALEYGAWKRQLGYEVLLSGYPRDTGPGSSGISARIRRGYEEEGVTHVVLVGRGETLPPAVFDPVEQHRQDPGTTLAVSDVPYGLVSGLDFRQDVFLSRLSVSNASELSAVLQKLRGYERQTGVDSWRGRGIFVASAQGYDGESVIPDEFWGKCDIDVMETERQRLTDEGVLTETHTEYVPTASAEGLRTAWDGGAGLVTYMGHGDSYSWKTTGFSCEDGQKLTNEARLPFVSSCVCLTGNFGASKPSLAETLVSVPGGGGCGVLASTNEVYIIPPLYMMQQVHNDILGATSDSRHVTLGGYGLSAIYQGMDYCSATSDGAEHSWATELLAKQFHLLGDCSLGGRFRPSEALTAELQRKPASGELEVRVSCGGVGRMGSTVTVQSEDGTRWSARTGKQGLASLSLGTALEQELRVWVYDPLGGFVEVGKTVTADRDGDGLISHDEVLEALQGGVTAETGRQAMGEWKNSGRHSYVEYAENQVPGQLVQAGQAETNDYPFDCRKNPGGLCLEDQMGLSVGTPEDVNRRLEALWMKNWDVCRPFYVGESVKGKKILGVRVGSLEPLAGTRVQLLVTGGIHGNEECSVDVALGLVERLMTLRQDTSSSLYPRLQEILKYSWIYVIPCLNPDGLAAKSRYNAQGVDLDRAFPDGLAAELGTYGQGSSLRLWETVGLADGTELARGDIPEVRAVMRWCGAHRLTAALLLHSGGSHVYYPYGSGTQGAKTPDQALLEELAGMYAGMIDRTDDSAMNGAEYWPVSGEMGDWLYRYLGVLPLSVEVSESRLIPFQEDWPGKRIDDQLGGFIWWLERCLDGVGGQVVDTSSGQGVPGVGVTLERETPVLTDGEGRFFKVWMGTSERRMMFFAKMDYATSMLTVQRGERNQKVKLTRNQEAPDCRVRGQLRTSRPVPGRVEWFEVELETGQAEEAARILELTLPPGWRFVESQFPESVLSWRWETGGGLSVLVAGSVSHLSLPVTVGTLDTAGDLLGMTLFTGGRKVSGRCRALSAERATSEVTAGLSSLGIVPAVQPVDQGLTWRENRYVLEPVSGWCRGYWLCEDLGTVSGWFAEERQVDLKPGWNLVGVPWRLPKPRKAGTVMGEDRGMYFCPGELLPGKAYWIYSRRGGRLEW